MNTNKDHTRAQDSTVTSGELHQLAGRVADLAEAVRAVHTKLRAARDQPTRLAAYRLADAAGSITRAARAISATAADLILINLEAQQAHPSTPPARGDDR